MLQRIRVILSALFLSTLAFQAYADEDALAIIRKMDEKGTFETSRMKLSMIVYPDAHDEDNHRDFMVLSYGRGEENSYMEFLSPRTIKGLKLLSRGDDQWIYFASTGRRRKIASSSESKKKSVKGVGGDFSYEDLGGGDMEEKYSFEILESRKNEWVLEGIPREEDSVYSRIVIYVDNDYLASRIEYYTEEEGHYKDLTMSEVKVISGRQMATKMLMHNYDRMSKTAVIIHAAEFDVPIDEKYFNPARFYK